MKQEMRIPPNHSHLFRQMINLVTKALLLTFFKRLTHQFKSEIMPLHLWYELSSTALYTVISSLRTLHEDEY